MFGLPLALYGIGIVLIFAGIVWAALTRRARNLHILKNPILDVSDAESGFEDSSEGGRIRRGVGALFSSDHDWGQTRRELLHGRAIPKKFLLGVVEWSIALLLYAGLVEQYSANVYMRSWVHSSFPFAEFLLNFYAFITIATLMTLTAISVLLRNLHAAQTLEHD